MPTRFLAFPLFGVSRSRIPVSASSFFTPSSFEETLGAYQRYLCGGQKIRFPDFGGYLATQQARDVTAIHQIIRVARGMSHYFTWFMDMCDDSGGCSMRMPAAKLPAALPFAQTLVVDFVLVFSSALLSRCGIH
jgi:hypothetical protein